MSSIKKFNVKINDSTSESFDVGANATNIDFSNNAPAPFNNNTLEKVNSDAENAVPEEINSKASNKIYDGAHIRNVSPDNVDQASANAALNGHQDYTNRDETNQGSGAFTISYGIGCLARGHNSTAIGFDCEANGWASFAEGWKSKTGDMSNYAHAEGARTEANHNAAHAEGDATHAEGYGSHAEGRGTFAQGVASHAEGSGNKVEAVSGIAREGSNTIHGSEIADDIDIELGNKEKGIAEDAFKTNRSYINGQGSHVEGTKNTVQGAYCHAEGMSNRIESVYGSTVMGELNVVKGDCCLAIGYNNTIDGGQNNVVLGSFNTLPSCSDCLVIGKCAQLGADNSSTAAFIIGGGTEGANSNLLTVYRPASGYASETNKGTLDGKNITARFGNIHTQYLYKDGDPSSSSFYSSPSPRPLLSIQNFKNFTPGIQDGRIRVSFDLSSSELKDFLKFDPEFYTNKELFLERWYLTHAIITANHKNNDTIISKYGELIPSVTIEPSSGKWFYLTFHSADTHGLLSKWSSIKNSLDNIYIVVYGMTWDDITHFN